ncbi:Rad52/Rad22 family DNA repair protein [Metabacillus fastidiosus]|uniref:Rad52/Rad22 family DNA repair protein n=1 Tax=Metabacillus fastidiosus TaxID=1458 RepID=A0ABU6NTB2_9BACI|nr:Rad52/Rad22 family DNA repair protein [Metabacillus fastidiosus]
MTNQLQLLQEPFHEKDIEWRVQRAMNTQKGNKAIVLAYVTNRAIMARLDEVFGIGGWKNEYKEWRDKGVLCGISVKIEGEWVTKWDGAEETNIEAVKGGFSGSMKRAAVQWGIGRYLYDLEEAWVDVKEKGANYINDKKANVKGYWDVPKLPSWALPNTSIEIIKGKYQTGKGSLEGFDEWYQSMTEKGMSNNDIDAVLTQQLLKKRAV